jgi:hypothetical protein
MKQQQHGQGGGMYGMYGMGGHDDDGDDEGEEEERKEKEGEEEEDRMLLIKWRGLTYNHATWEHAQDVASVSWGSRGSCGRSKGEGEGGGEGEGEAMRLYHLHKIPTHGGKLLRMPTGFGYGGTGGFPGQDYHHGHHGVGVGGGGIGDAFGRYAAAGKGASVSRLRHTEELSALAPPPYKGGGLLRGYQVASLKWLMFNWMHRRSSLLADEMGLGKTLQSVAYAHQVASRTRFLSAFQYKFVA